ncbi:MAG: sugar transferase, partial [Candidatus Muirbacterium halophilum]|nr:sugar transferase [Candidatus Muirbacterium halophilum]
MYKKYFKRLLDIIFSILALIFLSPILLITAILVRFKLGS